MYYIISAALDLPCYAKWHKALNHYPATLEQDEYNGWQTFHATSHRGAISFTIQLCKKKWVSREEKWSIKEVRTVSQKEYLDAVESIRDPELETRI